MLINRKTGSCVLQKELETLVPIRLTTPRGTSFRKEIKESVNKPQIGIGSQRFTPLEETLEHL